MKLKKNNLLILLGTTALVLSACSSNDSPTPQPPEPPTPPPPAMAKFSVTITNISNGQPLSPIAIIAHNQDYQAFTIGSPASVGLEQLAEGGDNSQFIQEAADAPSSQAQASGAAPIGPGANEEIEIEMLASDVNQLSVISMLVNTNDAITGRAGIDISNMAVGDINNMRGVAYDAGTELNSELAGTIPGPADGGEGFNSVRDDISDQVTMHPGVVTLDDGLSNSVLTEQHRFDNSLLSIRIERTE